MCTRCALVLAVFVVDLLCGSLRLCAFKSIRVSAQSTALQLVAVFCVCEDMRIKAKVLVCTALVVVRRDPACMHHLGKLCACALSLRRAQSLCVCGGGSGYIYLSSHLATLSDDWFMIPLAFKRTARFCSLVCVLGDVVSFLSQHANCLTTFIFHWPHPNTHLPRAAAACGGQRP